MPKGAKKFPKKGKKIHKKVYESAKNCGGGEDPKRPGKCQKVPKGAKKYQKVKKKAKKSATKFQRVL